MKFYLFLVLLLVLVGCAKQSATVDSFNKQPIQPLKPAVSQVDPMKETQDISSDLKSLGRTLESIEQVLEK
ncbi:hypothetical protein J4479_01365 [Candidatus Woesearchaeota archaeon]|nr:hypothetical protein [Candidatus Woesearchaeota archaeon]